MKKKPTSHQMINAELRTRASNKKSTKVLKHHIPKEEQRGLKIAFLCECANPDCTDRISLTLEEYDQLHSNAAHFVIAKDHVEPQVEKIEKSGQNIAVVEKYALS